LVAAPFLGHRMVNEATLSRFPHLFPLASMSNALPSSHSV
jgi:hypothetical protein